MPWLLLAGLGLFALTESAGDLVGEVGEIVNPPTTGDPSAAPALIGLGTGLALVAGAIYLTRSR